MTVIIGLECLLELMHERAVKQLSVISSLNYTQLRKLIVIKRYLRQEVDCSLIKRSNELELRGMSDRVVYHHVTPQVADDSVSPKRQCSVLVW